MAVERQVFCYFFPPTTVFPTLSFPYNLRPLRFSLLLPSLKPEAPPLSGVRVIAMTAADALLIVVVR